MGKFIMGLSLSISLLFLGACSENSSEHKNNQLEEEFVEAEDANQEELEQAKFEVTDEVSYATKTEFSKDVQHYAVIKNTGKIAMDLTDVVVTYIGKDGSVIALDEVPYTAPYIIKPNEEAYIMSSSLLNVEPEEFDKAEMTISAIETGENLVETLETNSTNMDIESEQTEATSDVIIRGKVLNSLKDKTDIIVIGGALYDENNKLIATTYGKVESLLNPDQSVGFETIVQDVPMEALSKVAKHKVSASYYPPIE